MAVRGYTVNICDDCIALKGQGCNTPECVFCWRSMEEVGECLNMLLVRPVINGERLSVEYAASFVQKRG